MLTQLIGLAGVPTIIQAVNFLKGVGLSSKLAPLASLVLGICFNLLIAWIYVNDLKEALAGGLLAGLVASGWYDLESKK